MSRRRGGSQRPVAPRFGGAARHEANEEPVGDEDTWALLQDSQRTGLTVPDTGMVEADTVATGQLAVTAGCWDFRSIPIT